MITFLKKNKKNIYIYLIVLHLGCRLFSICREGYSILAVPGLLIAVPSLVAEQGL